MDGKEDEKKKFRNGRERTGRERERKGMGDEENWKRGKRDGKKQNGKRRLEIEGREWKRKGEKWMKC